MMNHRFMTRSRARDQVSSPFDGADITIANPLGFGPDGRAATSMEAGNSNPSGVRESNRVSNSRLTRAARNTAFLHVAMINMLILTTMALIMVACGTSNSKSAGSDDSGEEPVIITEEFARNLPKDAEFNTTTRFMEGLSAIKIGEKWGVIDMKGKIIIPAKYDAVGRFHEGLAVVRTGDKDGFIDKKGNFIIPAKYDGGGNFSEGLAPVKIGDKLGFIDTKGNIVIPPEYDDVSDFSEGMAVVKLEDKYGFINRNGDLVIPAKYDNARIFSEGLAGVQIGKKFGFIDKKGTLIIQPKYDGIGIFSEGIAQVELGDRLGFVDKKGVSTFDFIDDK